MCTLGFPITLLFVCPLHYNGFFQTLMDTCMKQAPFENIPASAPCNSTRRRCTKGVWLWEQSDPLLLQADFKQQARHESKGASSACREVIPTESVRAATPLCLKQWWLERLCGRSVLSLPAVPSPFRTRCLLDATFKCERWKVEGKNLLAALGWDGRICNLILNVTRYTFSHVFS